MNTSDVINLLASSVKEDNGNATSMVVCGHYPDEHATSFEWRQLGAVHWDDEELFLILGGYAHAYELEEQEFSGSSFLALLSSEKSIADFPVYVRSRIKRADEDHTTVSLNLSVWGYAAYPEHNLICLMYGEKPDHIE